jgi:flagellar motor switch/type III secretory pathway protein FliN
MIEYKINLEHSTQAVKAYTWEHLTHLTHAQAAIESSFALWGGHVDITYESGRVSFVSGKRFQTDRKLLYLEVWIGNDSFDVYADPEIFQDLIHKGGFKQDISKLDSHALTLCAEYLLAPIINGLGRNLAEVFVVLDAHFETTKSPSDGLYMQVRNPLGETKDFVISMPDPMIMSIAETLKSARSGNKSNQKSLEFTHMVSYRGGEVWLAEADLRALQVGDGVMLSEGWSPKKIEKLFVSPNSYFPVSNTDKELKVTGPANNLTQLPEGEKYMKHEPNLEVEVSVELARGRFKVDALANIVEGAVLPFPTTVGSLVTLICNEERVATGELVEIAGAFGVRITKVN